MSELILVKRDGHIATVVLNRPDKLNALTKAMWRQLGETVETLSDDDGIRCIVLRGAGDKAFSPGNDIGEFETERSNMEQARAYGGIMTGTLEAVSRSRACATSGFVANPVVSVFPSRGWGWSCRCPS